MRKDKLHENDFIVVLGTTLTSDGASETHRILATVEAVGKNDIFAREVGSVGRVFAAAKSRCLRVDESEVDLYSDVTKPKIGDLVLSVSDRFGKAERKMGVMMEIVDIPGRAIMARILESEKLETVLYDNLIVLESVN